MQETRRARRVRIKVCGVTTPADAVAAVDAGADAIGLNFHAPSPRAVSFEQAAAVRRALPPFVAAVGVFVDPGEELVRGAVHEARLDVLQFHGNESAAFCRQFGLPYVKAVGVDAGFCFDAWQERYPEAAALMLDGSHGGRSGGTGVAFDWRAWPRSERRLILAGGLDPANVAAAIRATRPFAVDVASGVEGAVKGRKDADLMDDFCRAVASV